MDKQEMLDQIKILQEQYPGETIYIHFDETSTPISVGRERLPMHVGHKVMIEDALAAAPQEIVIIGTGAIQNPFMHDEREDFALEAMRQHLGEYQLLDFGYRGRREEEVLVINASHTLGQAVAHHMDRMVRVVEDSEPRAWVRANQAPRVPRKRR